MVPNIFENLLAHKILGLRIKIIIYFLKFKFDQSSKNLCPNC
jgi:hypothetical protein